MNSRHLWYLQLIISKGSFAAAAQEAGVSQPAVTQAMQVMESESGLVLFEKSGRQKRPTATALALAQHSLDLQAKVQRLVAGQAGDAPLRAGLSSLRIGMAPAAALLYGARIEGVWRELEPDGLLQIVSGSAPELLAGLQQQELDLVIAPRPRHYQTESLQQHQLHVSQPRIYARAGHPLRSAKSLQEIAQAGWAVSGRGGPAGNVIEEAHHVRRMPAPRVLVQCADYPTLLTLVAQSELLCVVPHPALVPETQRDALRILRIHEGLPQYEVCLFWGPARPGVEPEVIEAVVQTLTSIQDVKTGA